MVALCHMAVGTYPIIGLRKIDNFWLENELLAY